MGSGSFCYGGSRREAGSVEPYPPPRRAAVCGPPTLRPPRYKSWGRPRRPFLTFLYVIRTFPHLFGPYSSVFHSRPRLWKHPPAVAPPFPSAHLAPLPRLPSPTPPRPAMCVLHAPAFAWAHAICPFRWYTPVPSRTYHRCPRPPTRHSSPPGSGPPAAGTIVPLLAFPLRHTHASPRRWHVPDHRTTAFLPSCVLCPVAACSFPCVV